MSLAESISGLVKRHLGAFPTRFAGGALIRRTDAQKLRVSSFRSFGNRPSRRGCQAPVDIEQRTTSTAASASAGAKTTSAANPSFRLLSWPGDQTQSTNQRSKRCG